MQTRKFVLRTLGTAVTAFLLLAAFGELRRGAAMFLMVGFFLGTLTRDFGNWSHTIVRSRRA